MQISPTARILRNPQKTNSHLFQALLKRIQDLNSIEFCYLKRRVAKYIFWCFRQEKKRDYIEDNLELLVSLVCQKTHTFMTEETHPELNFIFNYYQKILQREIKAFMSPKIQIQVEPIILDQFIKSIYWRKWKEDKELKKVKQKNNQPFNTQQLNDFILKIAKNEVELPNTTNLDEAEFLYHDWKITEINNTNAKVITIGEQKGKTISELMRKICAVGNAGGGILFWGVHQETGRVEGIKLDLEKKENILQGMRLLHDQFHGRLFIKKKFLEVRSDPFNPSDKTDLFVLRIQVYPETEDDRYFGLKFKKKEMIVKEETCFFDERNQLKIVSGQDAYPLILRSYHKTHIPRQLDLQEQVQEIKKSEEKKNSYFENNVQPIEEGSFNSPNYKGNINERLPYNHQSLVSVAPNSERILESLGEKLREKKLLYQLIDFYPQFQNGRQIRLISHNKKIDEIKKIAKQNKLEGVLLEMITKALRPINELTKVNLQKLRKEFEKYFPTSAFFVENENNPKTFLLRFNNFHEVIFAKIYLQSLDVRTHFAKNV